MRKFVVFLTALTFAGVGLAKTDLSNNVVLAPEPHMAEASKWATTFLTRAHYKKTRLNDELSSDILDRYLESLDPNRIFFLESDILGFERFRERLDDALLKQDLKPAYDIFNVYSHRVAERMDYAKQLLDQGFDFTVEESMLVDRSEQPWAESESALNEIWRKRVKNDVLRLRLTEKESDGIDETLTRRYENLTTRVGELDSEDVFQYFMNAFAASIEPHTGYLAPRSSENFNISMRLSLEGIGAVLQRENEYTTIRRIVPGGPADEDGRIKVGDRIVYVGQEGEEPTDVVGWRLDDVVELIRGAAGTEVRLGILPADAGLNGEVQSVAIVREQVKLEEQAAQKAIFDVSEGDRTTRIGVIDLPAFYLDFAARARRDPDFRSSTRDVRRLIRELKEEQVDALVIDLRNNGGGSLAEATSLTGLFIDQGPVVQVRDSNGRVDVEEDSEEGVEWEGPLAVMVNRQSASASEIFAAAVQDYGRGIIIGEPTFGKGTVQNLINLDRYGQGDAPQFGQLRLTIAQFFRVNGGSTQHRGVIPDVVFPTLTPGDEYGESSLDNALPWTSIRPARYTLAGDLTAVLPPLIERSSERLNRSEEFKFLLQDIESFREAQEDKEISLVEEVRRRELAEYEASRKEREEKRANRVKDEGVALIKVIEPLAEPEPDAETSEDAEDEEDRMDVLMEESLRVVSDFVHLRDELPRTAQVEIDRGNGS